MAGTDLTSFACVPSARPVDRARRERDHDVLSALVAIEGGLRALRAQPLASTAGELVDALVREAAMARSLLAPADGAITAAEAPPTVTDLGALIGALVEVERARGVDLDVEVPAGLVAAADELAVHQILRNVLDNARRHAPGAPVRLHVIELDGVIRLEVRDGGPGMADDVLRAVRLGEAPPRSASGLGLGVARRLAAGAGGALTIESGPGGTAITVELPAALAQARTA